MKFKTEKKTLTTEVYSREKLPTSKQERLLSSEKIRLFTVSCSDSDFVRECKQYFIPLFGQNSEIKIKL